jgi:pimeloyl-ACP methyl ester carboxylesterase
MHCVRTFSTAKKGIEMHRHALTVPSGLELQDEGPLDIAVEIFWPDNLRTAGPTISFFCLPGGSINRHYYALDAGGDDSFSFAAAMAAQGAVTIAVDHLGIGDSSRPRDGFKLTPDRLARANAYAAEGVLNRLRNGSLVEGLPPIPNLVSIGVGHSMGGKLTILQQALGSQHDGLVIMGCANGGLMSHLPEAAHYLAGKPETVKADIETVARSIYPDPYFLAQPSPEGSRIFAGATAEKAGVKALKGARDVLLVVGGLQSMIPGAITPAFDSIDVPIFLGLGDLDIAGPPHQIPASFPNSRDVTLTVLPETGHCHFIFPSRTELFARIGEWASFVARQKG